MPDPHLTAPLLVRRADVLQVGADPPDAVLIEGPPAGPLEQLLRRLDGSRAAETLVDDARRAGLTAAAWRQLVVDLTRAGLLATSAPARRGHVRLVGTGALAEAVLGSMLAIALEQVYVADPGREPETAVELVTRIRSTHGPAAPVRAVRHWSKPDHRDVDLTVLAVDVAEPDRSVTTALLRADQPYLVLAVHGSTAAVGPTVLPGRTPCLNCLDLTRAERDPDWPLLLHQLAATPSRTTAPALAWAAATVVVQVQAHLHRLRTSRPVDRAAAPSSHLRHAVPDPGLGTLGATLELDVGTGRLVVRHFAAHGACGCHWGQAAEWGP